MSSHLRWPTGNCPGPAADLGWHRLKDIAEPEHLRQLLIGGLRPVPAAAQLGHRGSLPSRPPRCSPATPILPP
jgi:hypothetical protein